MAGWNFSMHISRYFKIKKITFVEKPAFGEVSKNHENWKNENVTGISDNIGAKTCISLNRRQSSEVSTSVLP